MLKYNWLSVHRVSTLMGIGACVLSGLGLLIASRGVEWSIVRSFGTLAVTAGGSWLLLLCRPPTVLVLGPSTAEVLEWYLDLVVWLAPLRVVTLLRPEAAETEHEAETQRQRATLDCLRTADPRRWEAVVSQLMDIAPIVVIFGLVDTLALRTELQVACSPRIGYKTVLLSLTGANPILEELKRTGSIPADCPIRPIVLISAFSLLRQITGSLETMPRPGRPIAPREQFYEDWAQMRAQDRQS
jgi:hypothetical protein